MRLLTFVLAVFVVAALAAGAVFASAEPTTQYVYDGPLMTAGTHRASSAESSRDQDIRAQAVASREGPGNYDRRSQVARASARSAEYRLAPNTARFAVDSDGNATMFVHRGGQAIEVSSHAARRMTQRGISIDAVESTLGHSPFQYFHQGVWKTGYYDPVARTFVGTVDDTVTTVIRNASPNYIQNLQAAVP